MSSSGQSVYKTIYLDLGESIEATWSVLQILTQRTNRKYYINYIELFNELMCHLRQMEISHRFANGYPGEITSTISMDSHNPHQQVIMTLSSFEQTMDSDPFITFEEKEYLINHIYEVLKCVVIGINTILYNREFSPNNGIQYNLKAVEYIPHRTLAVIEDCNYINGFDEDFSNRKLFGYNAGLEVSLGNCPKIEHLGILDR